MNSAVSYQDFKACMQLVNEQLRRKVPTINSGGCVVFASELLKRMNAAGMTNSYIAVFGDVENEDGSIPNVNAIENDMLHNFYDIHNLESWNDNGINFAHVVVEWGGTGWDALCPSSADDQKWNFWPRYEGDFNPDVLHTISQKSRGWCRVYDRSNTTLVREILDETFDALL